MEKYKAQENYARIIATIQDRCKLIFEGKTEHWASLAVDLYTLLISRGYNGKPLIEIIHPGITFHPIMGPLETAGKKALDELRDILGPDHIMYPGKIAFRAGKFYPIYMFDIQAEPVPRNAWLNQPYLSGNITIKELLTSVRNKEGAHSDPNYNDTLLKTRFFKIAGHSIDVLGIASIAEYIIKRIHGLDTST